jgi:hypothetical protein
LENVGGISPRGEGGVVGDAGDAVHTQLERIKILIADRGWEEAEFYESSLKAPKRAP